MILATFVTSHNANDKTRITFIKQAFSCPCSFRNFEAVKCFGVEEELLMADYSGMEDGNIQPMYSYRTGAMKGNMESFSQSR
ncbi:hypothetical protein C0J52_00354 [Blattella germanica]|nr:hypothetical protein C0J52_00354 [Blattella germanica]